MGRKFTDEQKEIHKNKIFIEHSPYHTNDELVKYHLTVKNELMEYCCQSEKCPTKKGNWRRKKMYLILERKNCKLDDLRVKNLRLICPNCYCQDKGPNYFEEFKKKIERKCKYCNYILNNKFSNDICLVCTKKMQQMEISLSSKNYAELINSIHDTTGNTSIEYVDEYSSIIDNNTYINQSTISSSGPNTKMKYKPKHSDSTKKSLSLKAEHEIDASIDLNTKLDTSLLSALDDI
jgi:hypothetical protein